MDYSGRLEMESSQTGQNTDTEQAIRCIEAIKAGIDKYGQGHALSISE
jgi:hypothetical protein